MKESKISTSSRSILFDLFTSRCFSASQAFSYLALHPFWLRGWVIDRFTEQKSCSQLEKDNDSYLQLEDLRTIESRWLDVFCYLKSVNFSPLCRARFLTRGDRVPFYIQK